MTADTILRLRESAAAYAMQRDQVSQQHAADIEAVLDEIDELTSTPLFQQQCRACGCTENNCAACVGRTGEPCYWVEPDLCSACAASAPADQVTELSEHVRCLEAAHGHMQFSLGFSETVVLVAQLQLAMRHPGNAGACKVIARRVVDDLIQTLDAASPGIGALLRRGDDQAQDVPVEAVHPRGAEPGHHG